MGLDARRLWRFLSSGRSTLARLATLAALVALSGCTPSIGDKCVLSTDCSTRGDRLCDTSQQDGYCTQFNCSINSCPDNAACVLFNAAIPGCKYDDRSGGYGARTARAFCVASCGRNSDCRAGYICADPRRTPWFGLAMDTNQDRLTCLAIPADYNPDAGDSNAGTAPVCKAVAPPVVWTPIDASPPQLVDDDASLPGPLGDGGITDADAGDAPDGD